MKKIVSIFAVTILVGCLESEETVAPPIKGIKVNYIDNNGLGGYIPAYANRIPDEYLYGTSHYSPVWSLIEKPIDHFQIGLPGTWLSPNNDDNEQNPLCPKGTFGRDNWPGWGPTWDGVFQTIEGSSGYWVLSRFKTTSPKYSMNSTPDCYTTEVATPGWPFFWHSKPLADNNLGLAQLSNRMLMPPDGLPFSGKPNGELIGYGYFALPLRDKPKDEQQTGDQHWTLFLNSTNFRGPLAFFLPEMWSDVAIDYPFNRGRGLDSRQLKSNISMAMEINTVPQFEVVDTLGIRYAKIPQLQFPLDESGRIALLKDLYFYSKQALYDSVMQWRDGSDTPSGKIKTENAYKAFLKVDFEQYEQNEKPLTGFNTDFELQIFDDSSFGIQFLNNVADHVGKFPRYFKEENNIVYAIREKEVPQETKLIEQEFPHASKDRSPYSALPLTGAWQVPGPISENHTVILGDCTRVSYAWYRFIDQPVLQQYNWSIVERNNFQTLIEKMHVNWTIDKEYLEPVSSGTLASFDEGLIVKPPKGLEVGYVPIVVKQELTSDGVCAV
jgi:hypothetical protein